VPVPIEENVVRFHVAVDKPANVKMPDSEQDLRGAEARPRFTEALLLSQASK
jgi:hypothetical protein